jgi:hypothetical protein
MLKGSWIDHKGKKIWFADYSGLRRDEFIQVALDTHRQFLEDIRNNPPKSGLILADVSDSMIDSLAYTALKESGLVVAPHVRKTAILGVNGVKQAFLNMAILFTGMNMRAFQSKTDALDWLVE